jgi:hypothetical protein
MVSEQYEKTVKCPVCGRPYKIYAGVTWVDQSACQKCVKEAEKEKGKWDNG